jgi:16S rRNA (guanine527-N7)-methyltransferase
VSAGLEAAIGRPVSRETAQLLREYEQLVVAENRVQNLISRGTIDGFWERHVLDSAQLVRFEPRAGARWIDLGSGAGLPGVVIACLVEGPVTLVEPRALRAEFLRRAVGSLGLNAQVVQGKAESVAGRFDVVTARAVAPLAKLFHLSRSFSTTNTLHLFPKGKSARIELAEAQREWQGAFHVEPSVTDVDSLIVLARNVRPKK